MPTPTQYAELIERLNKWQVLLGHPTGTHMDTVALEAATAIRELQADRERMRTRIERLRGMLKTAAGWFYAYDKNPLAERCMDAAGDMEPKI